MKDKKHIKSFGQFNENLNISDVSNSLFFRYWDKQPLVYLSVDENGDEQMSDDKPVRQDVKIKSLNMKKGQKYIMKIDKHFGRNGGFKSGDIIEYTGNRKSSTGTLSTFVNQNGVVLKTYTIWVDKFLDDYTNVL